MEITFPQYDVRFIAVNDGVDSINGVSDFSGIKNYFNDFYARDTSRKIRAVQKAKGERGERVGATAIPVFPAPAITTLISPNRKYFISLLAIARVMGRTITVASMESTSTTRE